MKIKSLWVSKYKNLKDINLTFGSDLITLMVGQNGLGKSNLIEIFTFIFKDLYSISKKKEFVESANKSELNDYIIEYECRGNEIKIDYHNGQIKLFKKDHSVEYQTISFEEFKRNRNVFLPDRIMGYYSGENKRLESMLNEYTKKEKRAQQNAYRSGNTAKTLRSIFFSENKHSQLILFTLVIYWDHPVIGSYVEEFLTGILGIEEMIDFELLFKSPSFAYLDKLKKENATLEDFEGEILSSNNYNQFADIDIFWGIKGSIDSLLRLLLYNYIGTPSCTIYKENNKEYLSIKEDLLSYDTLVENIYLVFPNPLDFFDALEAASSIGVLDEIKLEISKVGDGGYYGFNALSEGEQQMISVLGLMVILGEDREEVLYLIDEPDTHINPKWQRNFVDHLLETIGDNREHRHMFISTHSPFLVQAYDANQVDILLFKKDETEDRVKIDIADHTIKNWRIDQVLMSPYFDLPSSRPEQLDIFMKKRIKIIEKGILTKDDREELKQLENELGFLPTGETILEVENMALINEAAKRLKEGQ